MTRAQLTITGTTADALRVAKPALSYAAGKTLTMDGCVDYLLAYWLRTHPVGQAHIAPDPAAVDAAEARQGRGRATRG